MSLQKIKEFVLDRDIYGHKIELHFQGKSSYNTWLGLICTLLIQGIVLQSIIVLGTDFINFGRQNQNVDAEKFDRNSSEPFNLHDNGVKIYLIPHIFEAPLFWDKPDYKAEALRPEIGNY